jgi:hypothetical protein
MTVKSKYWTPLLSVAFFSSLGIHDTIHPKVGGGTAPAMAMLRNASDEMPRS